MSERFNCMRRFIATSILITLLALYTGYAEPQPKPLMKDFIGLNGHFKFKPKLYRQVCSQVRNYHNMDWDVKQPGDDPTFPLCVNKVNWKDHVYGKWRKEGFKIDVCAMFGRFGESNPDYLKLWEGREAWAYKYGFELAKYFGPSGGQKLVTSIEIGNEPGSDFDDHLYQRLFMHMAKGIRDADSKVEIVTATAHTGDANKYEKTLDETFSSPEIKALYDVINLHVYAEKPKKKGQSPWARSYPEDPEIKYLKTVDEAIDWRDKNTPGKKIWITEFGYDSATQEALKSRTGWAKKLNWQGVSDLQQAQYLVRSIFCFAEREVDRAYIYYYDDDDKAAIHAAAGLTRKFIPKMSFWGIKHLNETLGEYRFNKIIKKEEGRLYIYEFKHGVKEDLLIWVAWSPTGSGREQNLRLEGLSGKVLKVERMPIKEGAAGKVEIKESGSKGVKLKITETPVYIKMGKQD